MNITDLENIGNTVELYNKFKDIFFKYIVEELVEEDIAGKLIEYYNNYEFNRLRILIDDTVADKADICMLNTVHGLVDEVDNNAYKVWKKLDNMYSYFDEVYSDLVNMNFI